MRAISRSFSPFSPAKAKRPRPRAPIICAPSSPALPRRVSRPPRAPGSSRPFASSSAFFSPRACGATIQARPSTARSSGGRCPRSCRSKRSRRCSRRHQMQASRRPTGRRGEGRSELYALLETLYATGMRVSELIALPRAVLTTDDRVLTIKGKGGRERLVPLNDAARKALAAHLAAVRDDEAKASGASPWLFPSSGGEHLTRQRFGQELKALAASSRDRALAGLPACASPRLCQPSARARRRSCAPCSSFSAMPTSRRPRSTPMSSRSGSAGWSSSIILSLRPT